MEPSARPWQTGNWPGIGGQIKAQPNDFEVEEIPAYQPSGGGPHLYLWLEKTDIGHEQLVRLLTNSLGVRPGDIGTAGIKDRRAVTRQWVSVPGDAEPRLAELNGTGLHVLTVSRHGNKLRTGHLRGNRFRVLIREVGPDAATVAASVLEIIQHDGLANFYGSQRFGRDGETARLGFEQLRQGRPARLSPFLRKLTLSAAQSWLFNDYLARRMVDGLLRRVLPGDVLAKWPAGGMFVSSDPEADQPRFEAREVVPAGPIFGKKMFVAAEDAAEREAAVLANAGLTAESFRGFGQLLLGTRRHTIVYVDDLQAIAEPDGLRLTFSLPAGSYATVLLEEVMKCGVSDGN